MQNDTGTCAKKWHKTDTCNSAFVPAPEKENAAPCANEGGVNLISNCSVKAQKNYQFSGSLASENIRVQEACNWFVCNRNDCPKPIVATLKERFDITSGEAVRVLQHAEAARRAVQS